MAPIGRFESRMELTGVCAAAALVLAVTCRCRASQGRRRFRGLLEQQRVLEKQLADGDPGGADPDSLDAQIRAAPLWARAPPVYSPGLPVLGGLASFLSDPLRMVATARKEVGDVFTVDMVGQQLTFLVGSAAHKAFFEGSDEQLDQAPVYAFMKPVFGPDVIYDAPLHKRRQQMRIVGSCLAPALLRSYPPSIANEAGAYFGAWQDDQRVEILEAMSELTILTASGALHGPEVRQHLCAQVYELFKEMDKGISPVSVLFPNAPTAAHRRRDVAHKKMIELFSGVMRNRREKGSSLAHKDILQKLMDATYKNGQALPDHEIAGLLIALLFAGQHTSSITMSWTVLFLLDDKRKGGPWLDRVEAEIHSLEPTPGAFSRGEVTHDVVSKMTILHACIKEAIRLHPPLIFLMRRVMKAPLEVCGYSVPVGHNVMVSNAVAQRLEDVFENPEVYNPGRWSDFNIRKLPPYSFIGFGAGIHTCMGESFAFMQIRSALTVLLSSYEMELLGPLPEADYTAMVVMPKGKNYMRVRRREGVFRSEVGPSPFAAIQPTPAPSAQRLGDGAVYSMTEVSKHNQPDDCWLVYEGRVYDVTNYVPIHQGGDAIMRWAGKDATALGVNLGPQHPSTVPELLNRYYIGDVRP